MPRIGDHVRIRESGRTAWIRGVRDNDPARDEYGVVYDEITAQTTAGRASGDAHEPTDGVVWYRADEFEVIE